MNGLASMSDFEALLYLVFRHEKLQSPEVLTNTVTT